MTVRDLTPEQRRELLAAWDRAVRLSTASRGGSVVLSHFAVLRWLDLAHNAWGVSFIFSSPNAVAWGF